MPLSRLLGLSVLAFLTAGCNLVSENRLYREGIGTELSHADLAEATRLQNAYIGQLCHQAIGAITPSGSARCDHVDIAPADWQMIVQSGMNDIDHRCDAYLAWLDDKRRSHAPILAQINSLHAATEGILRVTGSGANPITVVGLAFGIASDTFTNVRSRLLLEVNHSTVQAVVLRRQRDYRDGIKNQPINTRPAAIYALRSYLRLCMPFTIEMEINTTVTLLEKTGPRGIDAAQFKPLIDPKMLKAAGIAPRQTLTLPPRPPAAKRFSGFFEAPNERQNTAARLKSIQQALCVPANEFGMVGPLTKAHIRIFENAFRPSRRSRERNNGLLDEGEMVEIQGKRGACGDETGLNYFERQIFASPTGRPNLIKDLQKFDAGRALQLDSSMADVRAAIRAVRNDTKIKPQLKLDLPNSMLDQLTADLAQALRGSP